MTTLESFLLTWSLLGTLSWILIPLFNPYVTWRGVMACIALGGPVVWACFLLAIITDEILASFHRGEGD